MAYKMLSIPDNCLFYQSIDLPEHGTIHGAWDHRNSSDVYLGGVDFKGKKVLDVGPGNGFFSFEIEKRGAHKTIALDLGVNAPWDTVPHMYQDDLATISSMRDNIVKVEAAFWFAHKLLRSKVELAYGSVYDAPNIVDTVDIALMSNVLQHFRDPFLAMQRVSSIVTQTLIITETLWVDDVGFMTEPGMRLIPRSESPETNHSWWQVSPALCGEILKLLGFPYIKFETHYQKFNQASADANSRMVKHFTLVANRPRALSNNESSKLKVIYSTHFHAEEKSKESFWRWTSGGCGEIFINNESPMPGKEVSLNFGLSTVDPKAVFHITLNNKLLWSQGSIYGICPINIGNIQLMPGKNMLKIFCDNSFTSLVSDQRSLGFRVINFDIGLPE